MTGIEELAARDIFAMRDAQESGDVVRVAFFEIAGDKVFDLLHDKAELFIREDEHGDVHVRNLETIEVETADELLHWVKVGSEQRCTRATFKNEASSRTHAICQVTLHDPDTGETHGKLSLVDLAGSERANDVVHHDMERQRETIAINKSLMALQECTRMRVLEMRDSTVHVPFRQSKLTMLLKESFTRDDVGTVIIVTLSPLEADANHTHCTCRFADRIKEKGSGSNGIDKSDPRTWNKREVAEWVQSIVGKGRPGMQDRLFPAVTGKMLSLMTVEQCLNVCSVEGMGRRIYEEFQRLVAAAKERHTSPVIVPKGKENRRQSVIVCDASDIELKPKRVKATATATTAAAQHPPQLPAMPRQMSTDLSASFCGGSTSTDRSDTNMAATIALTEQPQQLSQTTFLSVSARRPATATTEPSAGAERKRVTARSSIAPPRQEEQRQQAVPMSVEKKLSHTSRRKSSVMPPPSQQTMREEELEEAAPAPRRSTRLRQKHETLKIQQQSQPAPQPQSQPPQPSTTESADVDMMDDENPVPAAAAQLQQHQYDGTESPEFMEAFETLYSRWKAEVSDSIMDGHNYSRTVLGKDVSAAAPAVATSAVSQSELQWQLRSAVLEIANERRSFSSMANKSLAHLALQLSTLYSTFISRESRVRDKEAAEAAWLAFFDDLRTGIPSWETAQRLLLVSTLAAQHMRLFYISSSFLDMAPYAHVLAMRLENPAEHAFWSTLGSNGTTTHHYIIGGTEFCDHY